MSSNIDYDADHRCPVYNKTIDADLCYESLMALNHTVKVSSVPELKGIEDIEAARKICAECPYSKL